MNLSLVSENFKRVYACFNQDLRSTDTLSGEATLLKCFYHPSENGSTIKGKNLLLLGANSFLLELTLFQKKGKI